MATAMKIGLPTAENYQAAQIALSEAYDAVEAITLPLGRLTEYDASDEAVRRELLERMPTEQRRGRAVRVSRHARHRARRAEATFSFEGRKELRWLSWARLESDDA
jgi:hypothetical protein